MRLRAGMKIEHIRKSMHTNTKTAGAYRRFWCFEALFKGIKAFITGLRIGREHIVCLCHERLDVVSKVMAIGFDMRCELGKIIG